MKSKRYRQQRFRVPAAAATTTAAAATTAASITAAITAATSASHRVPLGPEAPRSSPRR